MIGNKKGIYHSTLVSTGPVFVKVTSDVLASKPQYAKGFGHYCYLEHEGSEQSYYVENQQCADALTGFKGQQVTITAAGREGDATLKVEGGDKKAVAPRATSQRSASVETTSPKDVANQWSQATKLALDTVTAIKAEHMPKMKDEQFQALVSGLVIYFDRSGVISGMPIQSGAEQAAKAALGGEEV